MIQTQVAMLHLFLLHKTYSLIHLFNVTQEYNITVCGVMLVCDVDITLSGF